MLLDCIADDYTGATDLASVLVKHGMRTVQYIGVTHTDEVVTDADAVVVALKSRTAPVRQAVSESFTAFAWLRAAGCRQVFFKYCATFDMTDAANIGPVADALLAALGVGFAPACPAFPLNARSVYKGYLFVLGVLLNESGIENHPLTPMQDAELVACALAPDRCHRGVGALCSGGAGWHDDPRRDDRAGGTGVAL